MTPELLHNPQWRFTVIPRGEKGPRTKNWQKNPVTAQQLDARKNCGLMLGPVSGGLLAIDFDGASAVEYWNQHLNIWKYTPTFSSNRHECRFQMLYHIPPELWDITPNMFQVHTGEGEQVEWRWSDGTRGVQSVMPPSIHPETKQPYAWRISPLEAPVQQLPDEILAWAISHTQHTRTWTPTMSNTISDLKTQFSSDLTEREFVDLLTTLQSYYPRPSYDVWLKIVTVTVRQLGASTALSVLETLWPPQQKNEYSQKIKGVNPNARIGVGSLINMVKIYDRHYRPQNYRITHNPN